MQSAFENVVCIRKRLMGNLFPLFYAILFYGIFLEVHMNISSLHIRRHIIQMAMFKTYVKIFSYYKLG